MNFIIYFHSENRKLKCKRLRKTLKALEKKFNFLIYPGENEYAIEFFPSALLYLQFKEGTVSGSSALAHLGPGFHNFLYEFLDVLGDNLGTDFIFDDETGYQFHRDFESLRKLYDAEVLKTLEGCLKSESSLLGWANPEWLPLPVPGYLYTPTGSWRYDDLKRTLQNNSEDFLLKYYIWPNPEKDAYFFRNLGLLLLWTEFVWVEPRFPEDKKLATKILVCFERARDLQPDIELPGEDIEAVKKILSGKEAKGKTYRSGDVFYQLSGWTAVVGGDFLHEIKGEIHFFWKKDKNIRIWPAKLSSKEEEFKIERMIGSEGEKFEFEANGCSYRARLKEEKEEGIVLYTLIGVIQSGNDYALVNISCKEETDIQWLLDTFASIFRDPKNQ